MSETGMTEAVSSATGMSRTDLGQPIFAFNRTPRTLLERVFVKVAAPSLERVLGLHGLQQLYDRTLPHRENSCEWVNAALRAFGVELDCSAADRARIPRAGPIVVVANHPFGGLEGLLLGQLLMSRRDQPGVRLLANYLLDRIPELRDILILVDPWARPDSRSRNARALKETLRHLRGGGLLGVFPAGEVAHRYFGDRGELSEPPWQVPVGKIIQRADAPVLPVYFCGENSLGFQLAGMVHPVFRTVLLPREMLNKRGRRVEVRIGEPIDTSEMQDMDTGEFTAMLQQRTEALKYRPHG